MKLNEAFDNYPEPLAVAVAMYGTLVAGKEAEEKYGSPDNYPEPLKEYLDRALEVAEEFINRLGL